VGTAQEARGELMTTETTSELTDEETTLPIGTVVTETVVHRVDDDEPDWQPPPPPREPAPALTVPPGVRRAIGTLLLAALFLLGFVVYLYGLSGLSEARAQDTMYKSFAGDLAKAVAPVGTGREGAPVAVLDIPRLGLAGTVVVEGTSSRDLASGPGHVVASALPGQSGVSVLYGKAVTFGAPFAHLERLNRGDTIIVTTGQGRSVYVVMSFGTNVRPAPDTTANRLVLEAANSATAPNIAVQVTADLTTPPLANPGGRPAVPVRQQILASDSDSLVPLLLWSQALLLVSVLASVATRQWSRWPVYLCAIPMVVAVTWNVYENLAGLLPNVY
jgi:LPXTG-site transpeptidase (sortase) family protein